MLAVRSDRVGLEPCDMRKGLLVVGRKSSFGGELGGDDCRFWLWLSILTDLLYSEISCNFRLRDCGVRESGGVILRSAQSVGYVDKGERRELIDSSNLLINCSVIK